MFLTFLSRPRKALGSHIYDADIRELSEDVRSLVEHDAFLFQKYDSCLIQRQDLLTLNKNDTIRRFSILAYVGTTYVNRQYLWYEH